MRLFCVFIKTLTFFCVVVVVLVQIWDWGNSFHFSLCVISGLLAAWEWPQLLLAKVKNAPGRVGIFQLGFQPTKPPSVYSMVYESSNEPKMFQTRKKVDIQAFFSSDSLKSLDFFSKIGTISIKISSKSPENKPNFPTTASKVEI